MSPRVWRRPQRTALATKTNMSLHYFFARSKSSTLSRLRDRPEKPVRAQPRPRSLIQGFGSVAALEDLVVNLPAALLLVERGLSMNAVDLSVLSLDQQNRLAVPNVTADDPRVPEVPVHVFFPVTQIHVELSFFLEVLPLLLMLLIEEIEDRLAIVFFHRRVVGAVSRPDLAAIAGERLSPLPRRHRNIDLYVESWTVILENEASLKALTDQADGGFDFRVVAETAAIAGTEVIGNSVVLA